MNYINLPIDFLQLTIKNNLQVNDYKYLLYYYANGGRLRNINIGKRQLHKNELEKIITKLHDQFLTADEFFYKLKNFKNKKINYIRVKDETIDWLIKNKHTLVEIRLMLYILYAYHKLNKTHTKNIKTKLSFERMEDLNINILLKTLFPNKKNSRQLKNDLIKACDNLCKIKYSDDSLFLEKYEIDDKNITLFLEKKLFTKKKS